jgi:hypothetical protein
MRFACVPGVAAFVGGVLIVGLATGAQAGVTQYTEYTDQAAFEQALAPGAYTETQMYDKYPNYAGGSGFSYTVAAVSLPSRVGGNDLGAAGDPFDIQFTFGPGIKAFGGYFYGTGETSLIPSYYSFSLDNGAYMATPFSISSSTFYGIIADADLVEAVINTSPNRAAVGNVIVGTTAVPSAPGPLPLFGAGAAFGWSRRLRRRLAAGSGSMPSTTSPI